MAMGSVTRKPSCSSTGTSPLEATWPGFLPPSPGDRQSGSVPKGRPESLHASQERIVHDEDQRAPMTRRITRFGPLPNGVCDRRTMATD